MQVHDMGIAPRAVAIPFTSGFPHPSVNRKPSDNRECSVNPQVANLIGAGAPHRLIVLVRLTDSVVGLVWVIHFKYVTSFFFFFNFL